MTKEQEEAVETIMNILLSFPWNEREEVFFSVRFNDIFCHHCGIGERDKPNSNCQCWNDD